MINIWKISEVPVEYRARRASVSYFVELLYPVVVFFVACAFVVMSFSTAPNSIIIEDKPEILAPRYYFMLSAITPNDEHDKYSNNNSYSYLSCNFPTFENGSILQFYERPKFSSFIDSFRRVHISIGFDVGTSSLLETQMIIPIEIQFTKFQKPKVFTYIHYSYTSVSSYGKQFNVFGQLKLDQVKELFTVNTTLDDFLSQISPYDFSTNKLLDISDITDHLSNSSITTVFDITAVDEYGSGALSNESISVNLMFNSPSMITMFPSPYYNTLRNTYIKLFYWGWVAILFLSPLLDATFKFGIFNTNLHYLLLPPQAKPKKIKAE